MPEISRFLGIVIAMYYNDHPPAHFHAKYGEYEVTVNIHDTDLTGCFPEEHCGWYWNGEICTEKS